MRRRLKCALTSWLLASWLFPLFVQAQPVAGPSSSAVPSKRNDWYWTSPVNVHWDNHGNPFGQGMSVDDIVTMFAGIKVDMIQVSARSAYTTYPSQVGVPNPKLAGYDTLATWREVTRRLGTRLWIYINVIDEPYLIDQHPDWQRVDAAGNQSRVCNRPSADGSGYLEQVMIPMVREISERYRPDGFWFDGDWQIPPTCYCGNCKAAWKQATGNAEPPKDAKDTDWPRWARLEHERLDEYKQKLADAIHQADAHCCYTSNWSWAISQRDPRTAPDFADTLSGDVGAGSSQDALYACRFASLMLSAQEHTPHDVMSAIYPKPIRTLPRMLQEGGLVMSSGSSWFLWVNQLAPEQFAHLRTCCGLVDARREALGRTHSLNPVAVLLSETSWEHGLTSPETGYFDSGTPRNLAFALQDAHYGVDVVNEQTLREQISHWRMVVLANQRQISPETIAVLKQYVEQGGTLVVTDGSLRSGEQDSPETVELLGVSRTGWKDQGRQALDIGGQVVPVRVRWKMEPRGAEVVARLAGREEPVVTVRPLGKGRVAYLASASFPYPDEDGMVQWLMKKLGLGPMLAVSGEARYRHLVFSLRHRERQQLVLHVSDLTTFAGGKRIEPNSSHEIDPVTPIAEVVLQLPMGTKPTAVKVVPATTGVEWQHQNDMLRLVLRDFQQHAAVLLDTTVPERLQLLSPDSPFPPPRTYETSPVILSEDFDGTPVGKFPAKPVWAANTDVKTAIHVAVDPVSPTNRVLEFVDAPDARVGFLPYLVIKPNRLDRGRARFACDCYLESEAKVNVELRDESSGSSMTGPSVRITETGQIQAGGKDLTKVPLRQWFHLELDFALGSDAPTYSLTIVPTGRPPERFDKLPYVNREFAQCTWLGVVSYATVKTHFYVDNLRLERLP
ncbi:MAG: beta-galactosidase trimerization domain-containing protein [Planctomycetota bacterium]|nr:beta-galactosidase trimerization domain-containing protein [Planctomycetota bacterium]